ncbi:hypothetical protein [uncultured Variovorax sp.]|uniref:hypothetical protein n=1 Tax=uncultured Variovorax sp. TaxID=114708 RepID=UPI00261139A8|nr:hypothetical protein [uncultured Variovorax sp.]
MRSQRHRSSSASPTWLAAIPNLAAAVLTFVLNANALAGPASTATDRVVPAAEQRARDSDRIEVLRQELKKSEEQLALLARRKAERLAASDARGAAEAEEQHSRVLSDVAALKRELGIATDRIAEKPTSSAGADKAQPARDARFATRQPASPSTPPWWDVYSRQRVTPPSTSPPSPVSQAPASYAVPATVSGRRLE